MKITAARAIEPAPERLGEVLLETRKPRAAAAFAQTLDRHANRTLSVLGLARARRRLARRHYRQVLAQFDGADANLAELQEARRALGKADRPRASPGGPPASKRRD